jgi:replication fork protection complex subunit Tof1/Swi1
MFKDNKLRLLMNLVGFERLGEHHDPDAAWIIPSSLTSTQLQEAIDLIRKFEFDPPTYEDGKAPEDLLRSKAAAVRRSTRRAEFDDDSDGVDHGIDRDSEEDHGEYAKGGPTTRDADAPRKTLRRRRRQKTPVELDDEEKDRRAEARRQKEIEKQAKALSTMYVHDSDDEDWDAEKDAAFFAREQAIREENLKVFKKSLVLGTVEPVVSKKRKADAPAKKSKRRKSPPKRKALFDDSDDDMEDAESSRATSEAAAGNILTDDNEQEDEDGDENTDTPLSSQNAGATTAPGDPDTPRKPSTSNVTKSTDAAMADADSDDDDEDDVPVARRPAAARNMRAGFVIDSDSE